MATEEITYRHKHSRTPKNLDQNHILSGSFKQPDRMLTEIIQPDHVMWRCNGRTYGKVCGQDTNINDMDCSACKKTRAVDDLALSYGPNIIGRLYSIISQGVETWEYYEPRPSRT
ncbi:hypothetical protein SNK04_14555 [Fusarium graminearum]